MSRILYPAQTKYLNSFRKKDDPLLAEMEEFAEKNSIPILSWHSAFFMEQIIQLHKPRRALEIGTAIGYSTIRMARTMGRSAVVQTIEMSKHNAALAKKYFERSGVSNRIELIEGDALNVMPRLDKKYDFIFLDADKEDYKKLFDYSMLLLKRRGVIFVDNLLWQGYAAGGHIPDKYRTSARHIRSFNKLFTSLPNLISTIIPIGDGIGLGIKK